MNNESFIKKVVIYGDYWDSYIYKDWLILICMDKTIRPFEWKKLINDKMDNTNDRLGYSCAFLQGDYLYSFTNKNLFEDEEFKDLMQTKFMRMNDIVLKEEEIFKYRSFMTTIPIDELPTDIGVYKDTLYYCNPNGVFYKSIGKKNLNYVSTKTHKKWDGKVQNLQIGDYGRIALSASSDGLFEMSTGDYQNQRSSFYKSLRCKKIDDSIYRMSERHSSYCSWAFSSIISGSYVDKGFIIGAIIQKNKMQGVIDDEDKIFKSSNESGLLFSNNNKIYRISEKKIEGTDFSQYNYIYSQNKDINNITNKNGKMPYSNVVEKNVTFDNDIITAAVTDFGLVVETAKQLLVYLSNNDVIIIADNDEEEFVSWRVFPRSKCYINQLHVVYNNRIEILSVNTDYFVNQKKKFYGNSYHVLK